MRSHDEYEQNTSDDLVDVVAHRAAARRARGEGGRCAGANITRADAATASTGTARRPPGSLTCTAGSTAGAAATAAVAPSDERSVGHRHHGHDQWEAGGKTNHPPAAAWKSGVYSNARQCLGNATCADGLHIHCRTEDAPAGG